MILWSTDLFVFLSCQQCVLGSVLRCTREERNMWPLQWGQSLPWLCESAYFLRIITYGATMMLKNSSKDLMTKSFIANLLLVSLLSDSFAGYFAVWWVSNISEYSSVTISVMDLGLSEGLNGLDLDFFVQICWSGLLMVLNLPVYWACVLEVYDSSWE